MRKAWKKILDFQEKYYPNWRIEKPKLLYSTALAGEIGEVCGVVTYLEGGGTNQRVYSAFHMLHQCVDSYVQLVLLVARYGFTEEDFDGELKNVLDELNERLTKKVSQ
jgi:hypothetical protein